MDYDTRIGIYGIALREGAHGEEILLALWNQPEVPQWTMPGGGVEFGEELLDALHREYHEETGLTVEVGPLRFVDQMYIAAADRLSTTARPARSIRIVHDVTVTGGTLGTTEVGGTTSEARWIPISQVRALPHVQLVDAVLDHLGS